MFDLNPYSLLILFILVSFRSDLNKLNYVHLCIKESNRIYPPVPRISRLLDKPYEIEGKLLPEGMLYFRF